MHSQKMPFYGPDFHIDLVTVTNLTEICST